MYMNEKLCKYLHRAYEMIADTEISEDVNTGLAYAQNELGGLNAEEKAAVDEFQARKDHVAVKYWREGREVFTKKVLEASKEMEEEDKKIEEEAQDGGDLPEEGQEG